MRLADMGVEPFLVCSTVEGVMAQRLVRTLCKECRKEMIPRQNDVPDDFPFDECMETAGHVYASAGCRACRGTGYSGRVGIYELLVANDEVRALASERTPTNIVKQAAIRGGMRTLRQDGWAQSHPGKNHDRRSLARHQGRLIENTPGSQLSFTWFPHHLVPKYDLVPKLQLGNEQPM